MTIKTGSCALSMLCMLHTHKRTHTQTHTPNALCMCVYPGALRHCSRSEQQSLCVFPMRAACALTAVNTLADPAPITNRCHGSQMPCSCTVPPKSFSISFTLSFSASLCFKFTFLTDGFTVFITLAGRFTG